MPSAPSMIRFQPASDRFMIHTPTYEGGESLVIKGFVSVREEDRDGEVTNPDAFDIAAYMNTPAVMVNHQLWINKDGNEVGVGTPISLHKVVVKRGGKDEYLIWDMEGRKEVDRFPKSRSPNLTVGDEGLYAFIRLHDPDVIKRVKQGELTAFSWRGRAVPQYVFDEKLQKSVKSYEYIDLWEISLVNVPNARSASFVVDKSAINSLWFSKSTFTKTEVVQALALYRCDDFQVTEDENSFYATGPDAHIDVDSMVCVKMAPGIDLMIQPEDDLSVESVDSAELEKYKSALTKETEMDVKTTPTTETPPAAEVDSQVPTADAAKTAPVEPPAATPETTLPAADADDALIAKAVEATLEKLVPAFEKLGATIEGVNSNVTALAAKMAELQAAPAEAQTPVEPEVPETVQKMASLEQRLAAAMGEVADVKKSIAGITPQREARAEVNAAPAAAPANGTPDPNSCFNNLFGVR